MHRQELSLRSTIYLSSFVHYWPAVSNCGPATQLKFCCAWPTLSQSHRELVQSTSFSTMRWLKTLQTVAGVWHILWDRMVVEASDKPNVHRCWRQQYLLEWWFLGRYNGENSNWLLDFKLAYLRRNWSFDAQHASIESNEEMVDLPLVRPLERAVTMTWWRLKLRQCWSRFL